MTPHETGSAALIERRTVLFFAAAFAVGLCAPSARAEDISVPVSLQAELTAKVAAYDRNLASRAGDRVRIFVLERKDSDDSVRVAAQLQKALSQTPDIVGLPLEVSIVSFTNADDLVSMVRSRRASILYVTPGFDGDIGAIARTLSGVNVLTISAVASYVPKRAVLGFDLVSGKPKLVVNITQAKLQSVAFKPDVLKLMKVYE